LNLGIASFGATFPFTIASAKVGKSTEPTPERVPRSSRRADSGLSHDELLRKEDYLKSGDSGVAFCSCEITAFQWLGAVK
jgi:hypothetical protein